MNSPAVLFYEFGDFSFDPRGRLLLRKSERVDVTPKALEILFVLLEADGRAVSKEDLIGRVWPDSFVEEANLSYTIYKLRRALGETDDNRYIETLSKRGYRFAVDVQKITLNPPEFQDTSADNPPSSHRRSTKGRKQLALRVIFASLVVIVIVGGFLYFRMRANTTAAAAPKPAAEPMTLSQQTSLGIYACAAISPDGKFMAYAQNYDNGSGVLTIRQTGTSTEIPLLEPGRRMFGTLQFSPDGKSIFYASGDDENGKWDLYKISVLGGEPKRLLTIDDNMYSISPSGESVYYYRFDNEARKTEIISAKLNGSENKVIFTRSFDEAIFYGMPSISPDGKRIALGADTNLPIVESETRKHNLFILDLNTGDMKPVSGDTWRGIGTISWVGDSSGLAFVASRKPDGNQLYYASLPSGDLKQITKEYGVFSNFGASVTTDGKMLVSNRSEQSAKLWEIGANGEPKAGFQISNGQADGSEGVAVLPNGDIVYSTRFGDDFDIWLATDRAGKKEGHPLTADAFFDGEPAASPIGNEIAFVSDRAGNRHIFTIKPDGTGLNQLTFGDTRDSSPDFTPDAKWIIYSSRINGQWRLWKIPAGGGEAIRITDFESISPSVSPDGKTIACVTPVDNVIKPSTLDIVSIDDGRLLQSFDVLPFSYRYGKELWSADGRSLIYQGDVQMLTDLWQLTLLGGKTHQLTKFDSAQIQYFAQTPDHKKIIASRLNYTANIVLIKNFIP